MFELVRWAVVIGWTLHLYQHPPCFRLEQPFLPHGCLWLADGGSRRPTEGLDQWVPFWEDAGFAVTAFLFPAGPHQ